MVIINFPARIILIILFSPIIAFSQVPDWVYTTGSITDERITDLQIDTDGNIFICGYFEGTIDMDFGAGVTNLTSNGLQDMFIAKYDSLGVLDWANSFGGTGNEDVTSLAIDGSGNIYISADIRSATDFDPGVGVTTLTPQNSVDITFAKYDTNGNLIWANILLGNGSENSYSLKLDNSDNIFLFGNFNATIDVDPGVGVNNPSRVGSFDLFFAKYDSNGNLIWVKSVGGSAFEAGSDMEVDGDGRVYICGTYHGDGDYDPDAGITTLTHVGTQDCFVGKYDTDGSLLWVHGFGSADNDNIRYITPDANGNVYFTGGYRNTIDFDPSGGTANHTSVGGTDIILAKYDSNGGYLGSISLGSSDGDYGTQLQFDSEDRPYLIGRFGGTVDFDPSNRTWEFSASNLKSGYVLRLDTDLSFLSATALQLELSPSFDQDFDIRLLDDDTYLLSGYFYLTGDFDQSEGVLNKTSAGSFDIFLARYSINSSPIPSPLTLEQQAFSATIINGGISYDGYSHIIDAGIILDTINNLTLSSNTVISQELSGDLYSSTLDNLEPGTTYYVRSYAINLLDTTLGSALSFIAPHQIGLDGNQDGILDNDQNHIHTLLSRDGSSYVTLRANTGDSLFSVDNKILNEDLYSYPFGAFEFKIEGEQANVELIFHGIEDFSDYSYRKINQFDRIVDFSLFNARTARVGDHNAAIVTLTLTDGGEGDYDGIENGVIYDPGGPAILNINGTIPIWDYWWVLILIASGWLVWRRSSFIK